jgi:hypothetical protein
LHYVLQRTGVLTALTGIFKRGKRDVLLELTPLVFQHSAALMKGNLIQRKVLSQALILTEFWPVARGDVVLTVLAC